MFRLYSAPKINFKAGISLLYPFESIPISDNFLLSRNFSVLITLGNGTQQARGF